jgi:predicted ATPase
MDIEGLRSVKLHGNQEVESLLKVSVDPFNPYLVVFGYQKYLTNWQLHNSIRTDQAASIRQAPVSCLEQRVSPDGQNLINVLHTLYTTDRKFKQDINDAMFAAFGVDFEPFWKWTRR